MLPLILQLGLAVAFLVFGLPKLAGAGAAIAQVTRFGYSARFARLIGLAEVGAAGLLGWGVRDDWGIVAGCVLIIGLMVGGLYSHIVRAKDPFAKWAPAAAFLILAAVVLGMTL